MKAGSNLEWVLSSGDFAVTAELGPPKSSNADVIHRKAEQLRGCVDAVNVTDNQTAIVRMSSMASSFLLLKDGIEPILQMVARDRNRIALQSDILGASALGIRNVLCLAGDHQTFGNHPDSKNVYDIDSLQLLAMLRVMRDDKKFACGEEMSVEPRLFLGSACNPYTEPVEMALHKLTKKVKAGADFIQTQAIFDIERLSLFMEAVRDSGLHERTAVLAGVIPMKSARAARFMKYKVPGMVVPDSIIERMEAASDPREEGLTIAVEIIQAVKMIEGIRGVHIMAIEWEEKVRTLVERAGLLPRPAKKEGEVLA